MCIHTVHTYTYTYIHANIHAYIQTYMPTYIETPLAVTILPVWTPDMNLHRQSKRYTAVRRGVRDDEREEKKGLGKSSLRD